MEEFVPTRKFSQETGLSPAQILRWSRCGIFKVYCPGTGVGSGHPIFWSTEEIPVGRLLCELYENMGVLSVDFLKWIYDAYDKGEFRISKDVVLKWKVEFVEGSISSCP